MLFCFFLYSCTHTKRNPNYSKEFVKTNPINEIALIVSSGINYQEKYKGEVAWGIPESETVGKKILHLLKKELIEKGYRIPFAELCILGQIVYKIGPSKSFEISREFKRKWILDSKVEQSIPNKKEFREDVLGINAYKLSSQASVIKRIWGVTKGDTIGFVTISGSKHSPSAKTTSWVDSVTSCLCIGLPLYLYAYGPNFGLKDYISVSVTFVNPTDNNILWQHNLWLEDEDPIKPRKNIAKELLKLFPKKGESSNVVAGRYRLGCQEQRAIFGSKGF